MRVHRKRGKTKKNNFESFLKHFGWLIIDIYLNYSPLYSKYFEIFSLPHLKVVKATTLHQYQKKKKFTN